MTEITVEMRNYNHLHSPNMPIFRTVVLLTAITLSVALCHASEDKSQTATKPKDPDLVRYYPFEEGKGDWVRQLAGDGTGQMMLLGNTRFGEPHDRYLKKWRGPVIGTEWKQGRFPGTYSIRPGESRNSVIRSQFYGTKNGSFSLEAWVRPREGAGPYIWAPGNPSGGFTLEQRQGKLFWSIATKDGSIVATSPELSPGLWHHVVAIWNSKTHTASLYVDGARVAEAKGTADYLQPAPSTALRGAAYADDGGLRIGGVRVTDVGFLRFDIDELSVFSRVLSPEYIATQAEAGKPPGSAEEQLARYQSETEKEKIFDQIRLDIPKDTFGYFPKAKALPLTIEIPANDIWTGTLNAAWTIEDLKGHQIASGEKSLKVSSEKGDRVQTDFTFPEYGLYFLNVSLKDSSGNLVKQQEYPVGIIVDLPPVDQLPETSPLGSHGIVERSPSGTVLGFGVLDRFIRGWEWKSPGKYDFSYSDEVVDEALKRGSKVMFCFDRVPKSWDEDPDSKVFNLAHFREHLTTLVRRYKDKVDFWEVLNEPNSGHHADTLGTGTERAKNYVTILKEAHKIIRQEDPDGKIVGVSGCPGFEVWTEQVLAAGGAPYFDIVSVHNYRPAPIQGSARENPIGRVRDALARYGKEAPIWNGEFGFLLPPRNEKGRPMSEQEIMDFYKVQVNRKYGLSFINTYMPIWTEDVIAAWTIQTILLDLGDGCQRVVQLPGAGDNFPNYADAGLPTEKGVAMAALASQIIPMKKMGRMPLNSILSAGVTIETMDGKRSVALFSDEKTEFVFRAPGRKELQGLDMLGNPISWKVDDSGIARIQTDQYPTYVLDIPDGFEQIPLIAVKASSELEGGQVKGSFHFVNPSDQAVTYKLESDLPKGIELESKVEVAVPARGEINIPFLLKSSDLKRGKHELAFAIRNANGLQVAKTQYIINADTATVMVPEVSREIPMRADPADWKGIEPVVIDDVSFVLSGKPVDGVPWAPQWRGSDDLSFSYRMAWNREQGILLLIEVTDDHLNAAPDDHVDRLFQYDCLELFFDNRPPEQRALGYSPGAEQMLVRPSLEEQVGDCKVVKLAGDVSQVSAHFVGRRTPTGYIIQGSLKPGIDAPWQPEAGLSFGLDMLLDDADEHLRKAVMGIGFGGLNNSRESRSWGWFELQGEK